MAASQSLTRRFCERRQDRLAVAVLPNSESRQTLFLDVNGKFAAVLANYFPIPGHGEVVTDHHFVKMVTGFGGGRIVDRLSGEQPPRIR